MPRCEEGIVIEKEDAIPRLFLDSGAPSLYNKLSRANSVTDEGKKGHRMGASLDARRFDDYTYINSPQFKQYLESYIKFVHENKDVLDVYVTVDIINNAEETFKILRYLESNGLKPIPVWHYGNNTKWLQQYIDEYDYIALGGMVPLREAQLVPGLDRIWDKFLTNSAGRPVIKVHGFAITAINLMFRYPWYSVDSTSWIVYSMYGIILVPKIGRDGNWDFTKIPTKVAISEKSSAQFDESGTFYKHLTPSVRESIDKYIDAMKFEHFDEEGNPLTLEQMIYHLQTSHPAREKFNAQYYMQLEKFKRNSPFKKLLRRHFFFG